MGQERFSVSEPTVHKLTVEEFLALDEAGFFLGKGRFELIEGEIYQMSPLHRPHARVIIEIGSQLHRAVGAAALDLEVLSPVSMRLGPHSLPEPDLLVAAPDPDDKFVELGFARLAIEVADASLKHDLTRKAPLYAQHGIPEFWIVDLNARTIHQMTDPRPEGYASVEVHPFGARVASKLVPQIVLDSARLA
ncbi:Uma2 family endonuclease [Sphingomonas qomolangmaensis]|uniref:Uma2 family endonuclease n=1 Tax=Sphingomonas qomolangmaensis TaxID=2918765 RepID=A0ABY5LA55_9SPHN|nr:Uma2 family endonuclease [Sphingomonas qomolangmaensis]UUL82928.1 Uma2 family endonuclease [Sphingomonas qomolangmaensis]